MVVNVKGVTEYDLPTFKCPDCDRRGGKHLLAPKSKLIAYSCRGCDRFTFGKGKRDKVISEIFFSDTKSADDLRLRMSLSDFNLMVDNKPVRDPHAQITREMETWTDSYEDFKESRNG